MVFARYAFKIINSSDLTKNYPTILIHAILIQSDNPFKTSTFTEFIEEA
jgi:hypothetical protein